jgi:hypothetical protein
MAHEVVAGVHCHALRHALSGVLPRMQAHGTQHATLARPLRCPLACTLQRAFACTRNATQAAPACQSCVTLERHLVAAAASGVC